MAEKLEPGFYWVTSKDATTPYIAERGNGMWYFTGRPDTDNEGEIHVTVIARVKPPSDPSRVFPDDIIHFTSETEIVRIKDLKGQIQKLEIAYGEVTAELHTKKLYIAHLRGERDQYRTRALNAERRLDEISSAVWGHLEDTESGFIKKED